MPDVIITPNSGLIEFRPSSTTVNKIEASGNTFNLVNMANASGTIFNIEATNGSLFSVVDNLSGTLMSVNNNAGLPVLEVFSDDSIVGGRFGQNDFVVSSSGNVGIGVANPSTKIEVSGTITANGYYLSGAGGNNYLVRVSGDSISPDLLVVFGANNATYATNIANGNTGHIPFQTAVSGTSFDSNLFWDNTNKALCIGTSSASGLLHVKTSATNHQLVIENNQTGGGIWRLSQTADGWSAGSGKLIFLADTNVSSSAKVVFTNAGYVGIGNTTPSTELDVTGTVKATTFSGSGTNLTGTAASLTAGSVTNGVYTTGNQSVDGVKTFTSQIVNTAANNTNAGAGQIYLNGATGNRIDFNINGVGVPSLFSRALGSKINLYPSLSTGSATDFAIGLANDGAGAPTRFWQSVDTANSRFEWFAGSTIVGTLTGAGVLTVAGSTSQINVDNLRLDGNILSSTNSNGSLSLNSNGTGSIFLGDSGLIEFRPASYRFIMSDSGPETICDFNESSCLFRKSSGGGATVALFIDRSSSTATVGINTNTPSEALEVDGTIKAKSLNIGSSNTLNVANTYGSIIGGYQSKASMYGEIAHAAGGFAGVNGTAQHTILVARGITLSGSFTVTIASPAVFTKSGHSLSVGDTVTLSTTGSLPTGLNTTTTYYVISSGLTGSTFQLSTTLNGSAVNTSGTQSGTHTLVPSTSLTLNGATGLTTPQLMVIPARSAWAYTIKISAYNSQNNQGAAYHAFGGLRRNLSTTLELETTNGYTYLESSFNTTPALVSINADTTNNALDIRVTGITNQSTRWVAVVDLVQVSFGTP